MKNIVLVGMMGSGKTTVAKALAQLNSQFEFVDIDVEIEKFQNMKISKIFEKYGERFFRELEDKFVKKFSMKSSKIIATGGGACENMDNIENLQQKSVIFYLKADAQTLYARLKNDKTRECNYYWWRALGVGVRLHLGKKRNACYGCGGWA